MAHVKQVATLKMRAELWSELKVIVNSPCQSLTGRSRLHWIKITAGWRWANVFPGMNWLRPTTKVFPVPPHQGCASGHIIGAVIIKHTLCLSDRETVAQIQENPYLQHFIGLPDQMSAPFVPCCLSRFAIWCVLRCGGRCSGGCQIEVDRETPQERYVNGGHCPNPSGWWPWVWRRLRYAGESC